ncbi:MAG: HAMP domain-containing histidine kinase [Eubacterium sp.]|nr:HAMP domain-containing histidine kinase [Eubacterium sp.]
MFKQLRTRFILLTMASVLAVLLIIMTAINLLNYRNVLRDSDRILSILAENQGIFPGMRDSIDNSINNSPDNSTDDGQQRPQKPDDTDSFDNNAPSGGQKSFRKNDNFNHMRGITEETPFESRYFSVTLDTDGNVTKSDTRNIAAVDEDTAEAYAAEIFGNSRTKGFTGNYRWLQQTDEESGTTTVFFLDCTRSLSNVHSFLITTILVSLVGFASVMFLVILFSRRIVRPIQESYDKQKQFITDAGHELKTPLTVINADLSVLEMDVGESEWIDDARLQTERLTKLTNDLVYLSRMDEVQRQVEMIDFPLSDVVTEISQSFRSRAIVEEKEYTGNITPMLTYHGDEKAIRQLVSILLDNALKYSPAGGKISLSLAPQGKGILLEVRNTTSERIEPESVDHLFDRFYRTDQSRNSETGGFGLGLAIAKAVVTAHRGKITAASDDGRSLTISALL